MKKLVSLFALAAAAALVAGQAMALDPAAGGGSPDAAASSGAGGATAAVGAQGQNLRVVSSNGVDIGTAISATTGPNGTFITVRPAVSFMNGIDNFQVSLASATNDGNQIKLAMTDTALRAQVSASLQ